MKRLLLSLILITGFTLASAQTYVELILDASGSMWNKLEDDRYRIVAAKDVLTQFIGGLPETDLNVGLRIYGSQMDALEDESCNDTSLFVPLSGVNKAALSQSVQDADARGATPIAKSLLAAADDFPADAERRLIVLVTDGEESCGGDLQAVAEELRNRGFEIDIRIIGFDLDDKAIASFEGVGTFENAENAEELAQALETAVETVVIEETVITNDCDAPATMMPIDGVEASYPFTVSFEGPSGRISLHPEGGDQYSSLDTALSLSGSPASLLAPSEAGNYELRYIASTGNCVLASMNLTVLPIQANLSAPMQVEAGFAFPIEFSGPQGIIAVFTTEMENGAYSDLSYYFTKWDKTPALTAPTQAGNYEIRYLDQNRGTVAATQLEVVPSNASLSAPAQVEAGFEFPFEFSGPEGIVAIFTSDMQNGAYSSISYYFTKWDKASTLVAPTQAGNYEIRYIDDNQGTLATQAIEVLESTATLIAAEQIEAGYPIIFEFTGPEGIVAIYKAESQNRDYNKLSYYFTKWNRDPSSLFAPTEAGSYELRYIDDSQGTLATTPIEVLASTATISTASEISAGTEFPLELTGPEGIVAMFELNSENGRYNNLSYFFTKWGEDRYVLTAPEAPGTYEIRYLDDHKGTLVSQTITVK